MEIHKLQYRSGLGWVNCAIFRCDACDKVVPYSFGCDDDHMLLNHSIDQE